MARRVSTACPTPARLVVGVRNRLREVGGRHASEHLSWSTERIAAHDAAVQRHRGDRGHRPRRVSPAASTSATATPPGGGARRRAELRRGRLSVTADAFGTDPTGITSYQFDFGDGTVLTRGATNRVATHTYGAAGSYTITLTATNDRGSTGSYELSRFGRGATVAPALPVSVGYADSSTVHQAATSGTFPSPWAGSPNVNYVGTPSDVDAGAIKIDNPTASPVSCVSVRVQIGAVMFNLWNNTSIPAHGSLILTETAHQNFDTSDTSDQGACGAPSASKPVITVWSPGGVATHVETTGCSTPAAPTSGTARPSWVRPARIATLEDAPVTVERTGHGVSECARHGWRSQPSGGHIASRTVGSLGW